MINTFISVLAASVLMMGSAAFINSDSLPVSESKVSLQGSNLAAIQAGTYVGTIACDDCEGIKMELTLKDAQGNKGRSFSMKQTYLGQSKKGSNTEISGIWFAAKGNKQNPKAVVLQLIPTDGKYDPSYFLQVNKTQIKMLDRQQNEFKGKKNYTLKKL